MKMPRSNASKRRKPKARAVCCGNFEDHSDARPEEPGGSAECAGDETHVEHTSVEIMEQARAKIRMQHIHMHP